VPQLLQLGCSKKLLVRNSSKERNIPSFGEQKAKNLRPKDAQSLTAPTRDQPLPG